MKKLAGSQHREGRRTKKDEWEMGGKWVGNAAWLVFEEGEGVKGGRGQRRGINVVIKNRWSLITIL